MLCDNLGGIERNFFIVARVYRVVANSMTDSSSCARSNPARPLLGLLLRSLSIRRSAAATRSRARSRSAMVYCRGSPAACVSCGVPSPPSWRGWPP